LKEENVMIDMVPRHGSAQIPAPLSDFGAPELEPHGTGNRHVLDAWQYGSALADLAQSGNSLPSVMFGSSILAQTSDGEKVTVDVDDAAGGQ
jgi:hypothetical protein